MAFEKEIKAAQKVCDGWISRSIKDHDFLVGMKKNGVAWEKQGIARIETLVKDNKADEALSDIEDARTWLADYARQCKEVYDAHFDFTRKEGPRDGTAGICKTIGVKKTDAAYQPVCDAMAKQLIAQTKQFKETEAAWTEDLKPKIDVLLSKLDTLEKLASGAEKEMEAFGKQFARDKASFYDQMDKAFAALKPTMAESVIKGISTNKDTWVGGVAKIRADQYTIMVARAEAVPKMIELAQKNYNRILKSIPDNVKSKFMFAKGLKEFEIRLSKIVFDLKEAEAKFKMAAATIKQNFPEVG